MFLCSGARVAQTVGTAAGSAGTMYIGTLILTGGDQDAALKAGVSTALFATVGGLTSAYGAALGNFKPVVQIVAHAAVGCLSADMNGGSCRQGAAAAAFGKAATIGTSAMFQENLGAHMAATVVSGAVGAKLTGGNAAEGALMAGMGYLFNQLASRNGGGVAGRLATSLAELSPSQIPDGADVNANIERAKVMSASEYIDAVKTGGEWDYKKGGNIQFEGFGNFNFGATCGFAGGPDFACRIGAGGYQIISKTSSLSYWRSNFDAPHDQYWITRGQQYQQLYAQAYWSNAWQIYRRRKKE
jgi:hypothetical protein